MIADLIILGAIFDNIAGNFGIVNIQSRDINNNNLISGENIFELVLTSIKSIDNQFHKYIANIIDNNDGTYTAYYNATATGNYLMRIYLAEEGLNLTYYNTTNYVINQYVTAEDNLGLFKGKHDSISVDNVNMNLITELNQLGFKLNHTNPTHNPIREEYYSGRYVGLIIPEFIDSYTFKIEADSLTSVNMYIGPYIIGDSILEYPQTNDMILILSINDSITNSIGNYQFESLTPYNIILEFTHQQYNPYLNLSWSTKLKNSDQFEIVPKASFRYWKPCMLFNTTIHPNKLNSYQSITLGNALTHAVAGIPISFDVIARDSYQNHLTTGNDRPTMIAIGSNGITFRGQVIDYYNSSYKITYNPTLSGNYLMYISIGCCVSSPAVGLSNELNSMNSLLIHNSPYLLTVQPGVINASNCIAVGTGILSGIAGELQTFTIYFRDSNKNPTFITNNVSQNITISIRFIRKLTQNSVIINNLNYLWLNNSVVVTYSVNIADIYDMYVDLDYRFNNTNPILGSPFNTIITTNKAYFNHIRCQGLALYQSVVNKDSHFTVILNDEYQNPLVNSMGTKLYVRLIGDNGFHQNLIDIPIPSCIDQLNGRFQCIYKSLYIGKHQLIIKLLNNSMSYSGGNGLQVSYYQSSDVFDGSIPYYSDYVSNIALSSPNGLIVPNNYDNSLLSIPLQTSGQAIIYNGYLVPPTSDNYEITIETVHTNVSIFVDSVLIYDTFNQISNSLQLQRNSAYQFRVIISSNKESYNNPIIAYLYWKTNSMKTKLIISQYYLYNNATEINYSPFPITITN